MFAFASAMFLLALAATCFAVRPLPDCRCGGRDQGIEVWSSEDKIHIRSRQPISLTRDNYNFDNRA